MRKKVWILLSFTALATFSYGLFSYSKADSATFNFNGTVNVYAMNELSQSLQGFTKEKFNEDFHTINHEKSSQVNMKLLFEDKKKNQNTKGTATGSIDIAGKNYPFKSAGLFDKISDTDTGNTYYYGLVEGKIDGVSLTEQELKSTELEKGNNSAWIIMFNPQNTKDEFYISVGVGYDVTTGVLIFESEKFHQEYYEVVDKIYPDAKENWK